MYKHGVSHCVETFITKKEHLKYSNYAPQYKINQGSLFTRCHLTGEEENQHLGVASRSSRRSPSLRSRTACQKAGLSPVPPRVPCTSPMHLQAALLGLQHPGGGHPRSSRRMGGRPGLHINNLLQSLSIFSSQPCQEHLLPSPQPRPHWWNREDWSQSH